MAVFAYGERHAVVDTNTRRVMARALDARAVPGTAHRRDLEQMSTLLPDSDERAAVMNAAVMELGQVICTARSPRCGACPIRRSCAWIEAGSPATPDTRRKQAKYEGSDRQARGALLKALRDAAPDPLPRAALLVDWHDAAQRDRALVSLENDGLIEPDGELVGLPTR